MNREEGQLVYKDQAAAELAADLMRIDLITLLDRLELLNASIDSVKLQRLIEQTRGALR